MTSTIQQQLLFQISQNFYQLFLIRPSPIPTPICFKQTFEHTHWLENKTSTQQTFFELAKIRLEMEDCVDEKTFYEKLESLKAGEKQSYSLY